MMTRKGFTLIELMIAVVIIALLATITIPALLKIRRNANENAAVATLRMINTTELDFKAQIMVDQDGDDIGEFGLLGELTEEVAMRANTNPAPRTPFLSPAFAPPSGQNHGTYQGYCFKIYLPVASGSAVTDNGTTNPVAVANNADYQENRFRCYAWPAAAQSSGTKVFVVDQFPDVYMASNIKSDGSPYYNGSTRIPPYNAATSHADNVNFPVRVESGTGNDSQEWQLLAK